MVEQLVLVKHMVHMHVQVVKQYHVTLEHHDIVDEKNLVAVKHPVVEHGHVVQLLLHTLQEQLGP